MGLISEDIIAQVLERCDIVQTVSSYIPLKKAGRNFKALCPFHHEKTPSFVVNPDKQIFHCFGCGAGGNSVSFVMKQENMQFPEAVGMLADKAGISIPKNQGEDSKLKSVKQVLFDVNQLAVEHFHENLVAGKDNAVQQARRYLKDREVSLEIVKKFKLGFASDRWDSLLLYLRKKKISLGLTEKAGLIIPQDKKDGFYDRFRNRITFPIFDIKSRCVGFGARSLKEGLAKYINSPETLVYTKGHHLYGFHLAKNEISKKDEVIIVEGYMDFIMPFQAGIENIAASLGTALTIEQIRAIRRYTHNVVMLFDNDKAGESATVRSLDLLIEEGMNVKVATLKKGDDPDSFIRKFGVEAFCKRIELAEPLCGYKLRILLGQHGKNTVEDRAKVSKEMLATINKFGNEIIRSEYVKILSDTLSISQEALLLESKKTTSPTYRRTQSNAPVAKKPIASLKRTAEYNILRTILEDQSFIEKTKGEIDISELQDDDVRKIFEKIYELYENKRSFDSVSLMSYFDDQNVLKIISSLLSHEDQFEDNIEKVHQDCLNRITGDNLKVKRQDLLSQMKRAEIDGDNGALEELKQKFNQLVKK